jgi:hypothetical protein
MRVSKLAGIAMQRSLLAPVHPQIARERLAHSAITRCTTCIRASPPKAENAATTLDPEFHLR